MKYLLISFAFFAIFAAAGFPAQQSSVTQYGITWTFDQNYEVGQFVSGDYWVLGPVTISSVSPAWDGERNGTMIDPVPSTQQGYRAGIDLSFNESLRDDFPQTLNGINSVISTIGLPQVNPGGSHEGIKTAAILTVVAGIPADSSFRPAYINCSKRIFTKDQIRYDLLPTITRPAPATIPSTTYMSMPWLDHAGIRGNSSGSLHPTDNMPPYYFGVPAACQALMCFLDEPQRDTWLVRFLQFGIDSYENSLQNGDAWIAYGGFGKSRKWPILFAGIMFDDDDLKSPPDSTLYNNNPGNPVRKFSEDGHTYYGQPDSVYPGGRPLWGQECFDWGHYESYCIYGGSGNKDCRDPAGLVDNCSGYLQINSKTYVGEALAARIMGAEALWGWDAFFDYTDLYVTRTDLDLSLKFGNVFVAFMWNFYRDQVPITPISGVDETSRNTNKAVLLNAMPVIQRKGSLDMGSFDYIIRTVQGRQITPRQLVTGMYLIQVNTDAGDLIKQIIIVE